MVEANDAAFSEPGIIAKCMLIFVRHGERLDQVQNKPAGHKVHFSYDPQMTPNGC